MAGNTRTNTPTGLNFLHNTQYTTHQLPPTTSSARRHTSSRSRHRPNRCVYNLHCPSAFRFAGGTASVNGGEEGGNDSSSQGLSTRLPRYESLLSLCSRCALAVLSLCSRCALAVLSIGSRSALARLSLGSRSALALLSLGSRSALARLSLCSRSALSPRLSARAALRC